MRTKIESNNNTLLHWICRSVVHQMIIISLPSLADRISQVWGAQPFRPPRLTVAWLWMATSPMFFLSLFLSASSFVLRDVSLFLSLLPWWHFKLISVITLLSTIKILLILTSSCREKFRQAHWQIIVPVARFTWCLPWTDGKIWNDMVLRSLYCVFQSHRAKNGVWFTVT